jgi:lysophospholipid acyltransferase (LPLAT)-like uncharacterized protein
MKLRNPWLIKAAGFAGTVLARWWVGTLRFRYRHLGPETVNPKWVTTAERFIYALWHENMLLPTFQFSRDQVRVLISRHADGQLLAEVLGRLGVATVRGSPTRGGVEAVRRILRDNGRTHLAVTPDGPRGPRRRLHPGIVYLAARTGMPIVPGGIGYDRPWRLKSWDRFAIPRPWTRATCVTAPPVVVPAGAAGEGLEPYRLRAEEALLDVSAIAERWAETGRWPRELVSAFWAKREEPRQAG